VFDLAAHLPPAALRWAGRLQLRYQFIRRLVERLRPRGVVTIRHGVGQGLRIYASDRSNIGYALGTTEPEVQAFLATHLKRGDVCCDIGANVGFFTLIAARLVGETGRVYAFEPLPSNAGALRRNVELNGLQNVEVVEAAVSDRSGTAQLILGKSSLDAKLSDDGTRVAGSISVRLVSLDEVEMVREPALIKIDAEGEEFAVLDGMHQKLASTPVILCELHQECGREEHVAAVRDALGEAAPRYALSLLEDGDDWWAPHAIALPRQPAPHAPAAADAEGSLAVSSRTA
jgi:FkbM family methyltransferase